MINIIYACYKLNCSEDVVNNTTKRKLINFCHVLYESYLLGFNFHFYI